MRKAGLFFLCLILLENLAAARIITNLEPRLNTLIAPYRSRAGVVFIDLKTGWTVSLNGSAEFPAASVAKVPVMVAAYHLADSGKIKLDSKIRFKESDKLPGSGVLQWMKPGKEYTLWNLIRLMIVLSDNSATKMVVEHIGLKPINEYVQSIGLGHTIILDPTMLVEPPSREVNLTSPADMAYLLQRIVKGVDISKSSREDMLKFMRNQKYRWGIWRGVKPGTVVADKTGNLEGILNDVGIVYTPQGDYILSVFTRDFNQKKQAREFINEVSRIVYEEYTGEKLARPAPVIKAVRVKKQITVIKKKLSRRPSLRSRPRKGRRGPVSYRKSRTYRRR